MYSVGLPTV